MKNLILLVAMVSCSSISLAGSFKYQVISQEKTERGRTRVHMMNITYKNLPILTQSLDDASLSKVAWSARDAAFVKGDRAALEVASHAVDLVHGKWVQTYQHICEKMGFIGQVGGTGSSLSLSSAIMVAELKDGSLKQRPINQLEADMYGLSKVETLSCLK